jgi:hypothetical protein
MPEHETYIEKLRRLRTECEDCVTKMVNAIDRLHETVDAIHEVSDRMEAMAKQWEE